MNIILGALRKRIELKLLKYNKKMMNKLNIEKEDFEQFILLKEMNLKFNLDIKDIDIEKLYLRNKNLDNDIIDYLTNIKFNKLIRGIKNVKFEKWEYLNLFENNIININLEKVNFKELKELCLGKNKILYIKVLEKVKFEKLKYFDLGENNRSNIDM